MVYARQVDVTFGECDPAGIAYYPRFFDWFHRAMEGWFEAVTGRPYAAFILQDRRGLPAAHTEADFVAPCRLGEVVAVQVRVGRIGTTSIDLLFTVVGPRGDVRARGRTVVVHVDLDPSRDPLFPVLALGDLRPALEAYAQAADPS